MIVNSQGIVILATARLGFSRGRRLEDEYSLLYRTSELFIFFHIIMKISRFTLLNTINISAYVIHSNDGPYPMLV